MSWKPINTSRKKKEKTKIELEKKVPQERPQYGDTVKYSDREYTVGEGGEFRRKNPKK
jgi:hypothetical protein